MLLQIVYFTLLAPVFFIGSIFIKLMLAFSSAMWRLCICGSVALFLLAIDLTGEEEFFWVAAAETYCKWISKQLYVEVFNVL